MENKDAGSDQCFRAAMKATGPSSAASGFSAPAGCIKDDKCSLHERGEPYTWGKLSSVSHQLGHTSSVGITRVMETPPHLEEHF